MHASLRERILEGDIEQGKRLVVRELAVEYETSDLPVREAIRMLQGDGLVVVNKNRGACVISIAPEDIPGAYLLRGEMEALAIRLAGPHFTEQNIADLAAMADEMVVLARNDEIDAYIAVNNTFHALLNSRCPYPNIQHEVESLRDSRFNFGVIFGIDTRQLIRSSSHHVGLVEALKAGDWERAGAVSRNRKVEIARFLLDALDQSIPPELYGNKKESKDV